MNAESANPIHVLRRMVDGMELPEFGDLMIPAMCPVSDEIEEDESDQRLDAGRNHRDKSEITDDESKSPCEREEPNNDGEKHAEDIQKGGRESVRHIEFPFRPPYILILVAREDFLHRNHEDEDDDDNDEGFKLIVP